MRSLYPMKPVLTKEDYDAEGPEVVYVIQAGAGGPIKVGWTSNIKKRLAQLRSEQPYPIALKALMLGGEELEEVILTHLRHHRIRGEWFHSHREVWDYIESSPRFDLSEFDLDPKPRLTSKRAAEISAGPNAKRSRESLVNWWKEPARTRLHAEIGAIWRDTVEHPNYDAALDAVNLALDDRTIPPINSKDTALRIFGGRRGKRR